MTRALVAALALLLAPTVAAAPWLQSGYDAARTGASPDAGPASGDVALVRYLEASLAPESGPLLADRGVVVLVGPADERALWRVDIDTGDARELARLPPGAHALASDGARLFVAVPGGIAAHSGDGTRAWLTPHPPPRDPVATTRVRCEPPAVASRLLVVACTHERLTPFQTVEQAVNPDGSAGAIVNSGFTVQAMDRETGAPAWSWTDSYRDRHPSAPTQAGSQVTWTYAPALIGDVVVVASEEAVDGGALEDRFVGLDAATGALLWSHTYTRAGRGAPTAPDDPTWVLGGRDAAGTPFTATGNLNAVFLRLDQLAAIEPRTGRVLWELAMPPSPVGSVGAANGAFALRGDSLFVASGATLLRIDAASRAEEWRFELPAGAIWDPGLDLIVADDTVYSRAAGIQYAIDARDGRLRWKHDAQASQRALGDGALALVTGNATVIVLGTTAASIQPALAVSNAYPAPGQTVVVDLAATRAGIASPNTTYRADWGDGTTTEWREDPRFEHAYDLTGEREARFYGRNDAGQTASRAVTFHVGATPPVELTAVQRAFSPERQEATFFLLGLLATLLFAAIGFVGLRRKRGRLARELRALQEGYQLTRQRPVECSAFLRERHAHAHALLVDGKLDESQFAVLERRVETLARESRLASLEGRFDFLPYGMVRALEAMLADGRIESWERHHFLDVLARDTLLTSEQKASVRALVEGWYASDAGVGSTT